MILIIDNYDSFTYNLYQYLGELGRHVKVVRNDAISVRKIKDLNPKFIVISPGPGNPSDAGISVNVVKMWGGKIPILGVCLGHQCIGSAYGAKIVHAKKLMHGKTSRIRHDGKGIYRNLSNPFEATRYHSLAVKEASIPHELLITSRSEDNEIMGLRHKSIPNLEGVQFHPESILTKEGKKLLQNFLLLLK